MKITENKLNVTAIRGKHMENTNIVVGLNGIILQRVKNIKYLVCRVSGTQLEKM
jgi:hypothetical protein